MQSIQTRAGENYLTEADEKTLFNHLKRLKDKQAERDYALLKTCRLLGLRRSEAIALDVSDIFGKKVLEIDGRIAAKGALGSLSIPVELQEILQGFLRLKRQWGEDLSDGAPLFMSKKGNRLALRTFNDLVDKWCAAAGIPRITPHGLRHTKGRRIMDDVRHLTEEERDKKLLLANRQLRHKSITATLIYTAPTKEEMAKVGAL